MTSKRRVRRNECGDKVKYTSHQKALDAAYNLYRKKGGELCIPYTCTWGEHIHIGHPVKKQEDATRIAKRRNDRAAEVEQAHMKSTLQESQVTKKQLQTKANKRKAAAHEKAKTSAAYLEEQARRKNYNDEKHKEVVLGYSEHSSALDAQLAAILKH